MEKFLNPKELNKNRIVRIISIIGVVVGVVLIIYPFVPAIVWQFKKKGDDKLVLPYETDLTPEDFNVETFEGAPKPIPTENRLVIPKIDVDVEIVEGSNDSALLRGAWHRPGTGDPVSGSNYVITGHRFRYLPPNNTTFYNLDKLEQGDLIIVYYQQQEYDYVVSEEFIVTPDQIEIEEGTAEHILTLYTCTPLWTSDKRLVIKALPKVN